MDDTKLNNFDLLRLIAALQVVFGHACLHLQIGKHNVLQILWTIIANFPGVPIFFMTSGFLISASYERNLGLINYFTNRALRIYPALWTAFFVSLAFLTFSGYWQHAHVSILSFLQWVLAQLSFAQFYNPMFLRNFGIGVLNGSLWTISVELQFYLLIPIVYYFIKKQSKNQINYFLLTLIILFGLIRYAYNSFWETNTTLMYKIFNITFFPHFYIFLIGILLQRNKSYFQVIENKFPIYFISYLLLCYLLRHHTHLNNNTINFYLLPFLCLVSISFAFSYKNLSFKLLKKQDISYGIYIYHMLVINIFVYYQMNNNIMILFWVFGFTIVLATLSWILIEKPCLKLKKYHRIKYQEVLQGV